MSAPVAIDRDLLEKIESTTVVSLQPGDKLILRVSGNWRPVEIERLHSMLQKFFGEFSKNILVLSADIEPFVLRQESSNE